MGVYSFNELAKQVYLTAPFIVVADIETTGFSSKYDEIIEIGAVVLDMNNRCLATGENGKVKKFSVFIRPQNHKTIPPKITELTGITQQMVESKGISRNQAIEGFYQFIGNYPVAFHNAAFDWERFLSRDMVAVGRRPSNPIVCTMELAKYLYPGRKRYNLEEMCQFLGKTTVEGHHQAWVDCTYTASLLLCMKDKLVAQGETVNEEQLSIGSVPVCEAKNIIIHRVQRWKKGQYDRIYVQTNIGSLFYDIKKNNWAYKELRRGVQLGIDDCVKQVLQQLNASTDELVSRYTTESEEKTCKQ